MPRKRVTSPQLVEVRTLLTRAKTALGEIHREVNHRAYIPFEDRKYYKHVHTTAELAEMAKGLREAIDWLSVVELDTGWRDED